MKLIALLVAAVCGMASAQGPRATATLTIDKPSASAGGTITGHVSVTFPTGYHAYQNPPTDEFQIPVKVQLSKASKFKLVKVAYPKGVPMKVAGDAKPSAVYTDTVSIPVTFKAPAKPGAATITLNFSYQQCNDSSCLPPDNFDLVAKLTVKPAAKKPKHS